MKQCCDNEASVATEKFVGLKPKIYSHLTDDNSEHKKGKGRNKNVVEIIIQYEYINMFC